MQSPSLLSVWCRPERDERRRHLYRDRRDTTPAAPSEARTYAAIGREALPHRHTLQLAGRHVTRAACDAV